MASADRRSPLPERALHVLGLAVIACAAGLVLTFDHGRDQSIYALVARETLAGGAPYRDAFDFKPPGIFFVYAVTRALFGSAMGGIRVVEVLAMLATALGLVRLAERWANSRGVGILAAAIASQIHAQLDFWHTAQPETFGAPLTIWGLVLAGRAYDASSARRRRLLLVAVGVLYGISGLMKPPLAGVGALLSVFLVMGVWMRARSERRSPRALALLEPPLLIAAGGAAPFVVTLGWFASKGALGDLHEVLFVFTPHYTKVSWQNVSVLGMAYYGFEEWLTTYSSTLLAGLIGLAVLGAKDDERTLVAVVLGAIFVHVAGIVMQGKFFPYHWGATFPLTSLLAALGIAKAWRAARAKGALASVAFAGALAVLASAKCPVPSFGDAFVIRSAARVRLLLEDVPDKQAAWDELASVADVNAGQNRAVAMYLREHTRPEDPIFVWGFECAIYDIAERPLASRYIYNVPQRAAWSAEPMQAALMRDLAARPPAAIVVEHHDVFRMVTGNDEDSARSLRTFPALEELLETSFDHAERIGDFDVYLRRPPAEG
jgi:hypothetical protein